MMMGGMGMGSGLMTLVSGLLMTAVMLGFAYIVWVLSAKESGNVKTIGQVLSIIIAVLVVIIFLYGAVNAGRMRGHYGSKMGGKQTKEMQKMMKQMQKGGLQKMLRGIKHLMPGGPR